MKNRRTKKSAAARVRPFWILLVFAFVAAGAGGYYAAMWPGFHLKSLRLSGNRVVSERRILDAAQIDGRSNIWLQNMHAAAARIERIPSIEEAHISRSLPATVSIVVYERQPYARVREGKQLIVVDRTLRVLEPTRGRGAELASLQAPGPPPVSEEPGRFIHSEALRELAKDLGILNAAGLHVRQLRLDRLSDLSAVLAEGTIVLLGDDSDLAQKAALVEPIRAQAGQGKVVRRIDVRAPKTPVVSF